MMSLDPRGRGLRSSAEPEPGRCWVPNRKGLKSIIPLVLLFLALEGGFVRSPYIFRLIRAFPRRLYTKSLKENYYQLTIYTYKGRLCKVVTQPMSKGRLCKVIPLLLRGFVSSLRNLLSDAVSVITTRRE
jgi:hypothetical protein